MAVKRKKYSSKTLPQKKSQEEYDLKLSFSRLNQYHSVDNSQTDSYKERKESSSYLRSNQQQGLSYTSETSIGDSYFRLEDKISALSDKNDSAHTKLREDFDKKVKAHTLDISNDLPIACSLINAIGMDPCKLCTYCWNGKE